MQAPVLFPAVAPAPAAPSMRAALARLLVAASRGLAALAQALAQRPASAAATPPTAQFEFHADAGAPEGALYIDGQLVARLPGVSRL